MLLLRFCLLWGLVAVHVLGGAILFRRLCPRESPWFGFIVPAMAIVLGLNLLEHAVGFPSLRGLLPFTFLGSLWLIIFRRTNWRLRGGSGSLIRMVEASVWGASTRSIFSIAFRRTLCTRAVGCGVGACYGRRNLASRESFSAVPRTTPAGPLSRCSFCGRYAE